MKTFLPTLLALICMPMLACQSKIGDDCSDNVSCSPDGDRICDLSQPGGYCTVPDCVPGSCPDNGVCVRFWTGAHTRTWCMKDCGSDSDCRDDYLCAPHSSEVGEVIDEGREDTGYCVQGPEHTSDAGEEEL